MEFEIHITVKNNIDITDFKRDCIDIGVKPILITLGSQQQLMTSSKHSYNGGIKEILIPLYEKLLNKGYDVLRLKVEKRPEFIKDINFKYYETHLRLALPKNYDYTDLKRVCNEKDFHLSKNLFKVDTEYNYQMITNRTKTGDLNQFITLVNVMCDNLRELRIKFDKIEIEECIFDTNESLDSEWLFSTSQMLTV